MLTVQDLMTIDPDIVTPDTPLQTVIAMMNRRGSRQLPVVEDGKLVGIITDRDVRLAVNSSLLAADPIERLDLISTHTAGECMTPNPTTVTPDTPIYEVARILGTYKYGALPVVVKYGEEEILEGIITVTDLLNRMALRPEPAV